MAETLTEKQSRKQLLDWARQYGCEAELMKIFSRYDDLLKGCRTNEERNAVATMGVIEIDKFFGGKGNEITITPKKGIK